MGHRIFSFSFAIISLGNIPSALLQGSSISETLDLQMYLSSEISGPLTSVAKTYRAALVLKEDTIIVEKLHVSNSEFISPSALYQDMF
jgi:hypothetical protein